MVNVNTVDLLEFSMKQTNEVVDAVELEIWRLLQLNTMFSGTFTPHKISYFDLIEVNMVNADTVDHLYFSMPRQ